MWGMKFLWDMQDMQPGSGILSRIMNKSGITKGMQTVIDSDVHRNRPHAYIHRHKKYKEFIKA